MIETKGHWLGQDRLFFNKDFIDPQSNPHIFSKSNSKISEAGLSLYLEHGFSVFGQTIFSNGAFLSPGDHVIRECGGSWSIQPEVAFDKHPNKTLSGEVIFWEMREALNAELSNFDGYLILPLSGGLDSRTLLWALRDFPRDQILTFSYGTSFPQFASSEILIAQEMASREGVKWTPIQFDSSVNSPENFDLWFKLMGPHTHAHGMYHIDFFKQIKEITGNSKALVLSGLVGDLFSGKIAVPEISSPNDLRHLNYSHGLHAPKWAYKAIASQAKGIKEEYFERKKFMWSDPDHRLIELIRNKMMLLNYLVEVPRGLGFEVRTPFTEFQIAMSMVLMPQEKKVNRMWHREFLSNQGLGESSRNLGLSNNSLDLQTIQNISLPKIDVQNLNPYFHPEWLKSVSSVRIPSTLENRIYKSPLGGSKKTAIGNLFPKLAPGLSRYRGYQLLYPLARAFSDVS